MSNKRVHAWGHYNIIYIYSITVKVRHALMHVTNEQFVYIQQLP